MNSRIIPVWNWIFETLERDKATTFRSSLLKWKFHRFNLVNQSLEHLVTFMYRCLYSSLVLGLRWRYGGRCVSLRKNFALHVRQSLIHIVLFYIYSLGNLGCRSNVLNFVRTNSWSRLRFCQTHHRHWVIILYSWYFWISLYSKCYSSVRGCILLFDIRVRWVLRRVFNNSSPSVTTEHHDVGGISAL